MQCLKHNCPSHIPGNLPKGSRRNGTVVIKNLIPVPSRISLKGVEGILLLGYTTCLLHHQRISLKGVEGVIQLTNTKIAFGGVGGISLKGVEGLRKSPSAHRQALWRNPLNLPKGSRRVTFDEAGTTVERGVVKNLPKGSRR